jgi:methionyl-tRNA synthetase
LLGISKHNFYRTSSKIHKTKVQRVFKNFINKGDIYLGQYEGNYCITCEDYVTLSNLAEKKDICPFCNTKLNPIKEKAYFLNVSKYFAWLRSYYHEDEGLIIPGSIKKEMKESFMKDEKVRDLCISRKDIT